MQSQQHKAGAYRGSQDGEGGVDGHNGNGWVDKSGAPGVYRGGYGGPRPPPGPPGSIRAQPPRPPPGIHGGWPQQRQDQYRFQSNPRQPYHQSRESENQQFNGHNNGNNSAHRPSSNIRYQSAGRRTQQSNFDRAISAERRPNSAEGRTAYRGNTYYQDNTPNGIHNYPSRPPPPRNITPYRNNPPLRQSPPTHNALRDPRLPPPPAPRTFDPKPIPAPPPPAPTSTPPSPDDDDSSAGASVNLPANFEINDEVRKKYHMLQSTDGKIILLRKTPRGKRGGVKHRKPPRDGSDALDDPSASPGAHQPDANGNDSDHSSSDALSFPLHTPPPPPPPRDTTSPTRVQSMVSALNQQLASSPPPDHHHQHGSKPLSLLSLSPSASPSAKPSPHHSHSHDSQPHSPETPPSTKQGPPGTEFALSDAVHSEASPAVTPKQQLQQQREGDEEPPQLEHSQTPEQKLQKQAGEAAADLAAAREEQAADEEAARQVEELMRELQEVRDAKQRAEEAQEQLTIQAQCLLQEKSSLLQRMTQRERQIADLQERLEYVEQECEDLRQVGGDGDLDQQLLAELRQEGHLGLEGLLDH